MKKLIYLPLLLLTLVVGVNKVHALDSVYLSNYYDNYGLMLEIDNSYSSIISNLKTYYINNFSSDYTNYIIYVNYGLNNSTTLSNISLVATNITSFYYYKSSNFEGFSSNTGYQDSIKYTYDISNETYSSSTILNSLGLPNSLVYESNNSLTFVDSSHCSASITSNCSNLVQLPSYSDLNYDVSFPLINIRQGDTIPTYMSLTNGEPSADFTQVDMSEYEYIILSLKNYDTQPFNTTIYSLGRLCFTPVYNYGMTEVNTLYGSYQTQGCTEYYNTSTPVMIFIIQDDIDNNAVYYIKRYSDETNILSIPTSIFDITYITSSNVNDPQIEINGRSYPGIPYSQLNDTANKSSEEGYVSGRVCALGDVNCYSETGLDIDIDNIWTKPLDTLKSLWSGITNFFTLVSTFIALLPSPLKEFLITAFMLAIILGIIKIIL